MIPQAAITEWGRTVPWPTVEQVEQDLLLSRLIVEIANDDYLGSEYPKMFLRAPYESGVGGMRLKVEINTFDRAPANSPVKLPFSVDSSWFSARAEVLTFTLEELIATKIRALFQRSKGRDLFDFWLALTQLGVTPSAVVKAFAPYRPDGYTKRRAELNLREKVQRSAFREDIGALVTAWLEGYDIDVAAELIIADVLALIE